jgi:hypothetical protein
MCIISCCPLWDGLNCKLIVWFSNFLSWFIHKQCSPLVQVEGLWVRVQKGFVPTAGFPLRAKIWVSFFFAFLSPLPKNYLSFFQRHRIYIFIYLISYIFSPIVFPLFFGGGERIIWRDYENQFPLKLFSLAVGVPVVIEYIIFICHCSTYQLIYR